MTDGQPRNCKVLRMRKMVIAREKLGPCKALYIVTDTGQYQDILLSRPNLELIAKS